MASCSTLSTCSLLLLLVLILQPLVSLSSGQPNIPTLSTLEAVFCHVPPLIYTKTSASTRQGDDTNAQQGGTQNGEVNSTPQTTEAGGGDTGGSTPQGGSTIGVTTTSRVDMETTGDPRGMMVDVLRVLVRQCYVQDISVNFTADKCRTQDQLESNLESHFSLPVTRSGLRQVFYGQFTTRLAFIPVFESPGVQYLSAVGYNTAGPAGALLATWPLCLLMFLSSALAGSLIWICERLASTGEFPDRFAVGFCEGLWWAVVTMTTVGYGDLKPASPVGRLLASVWMLIGTIVIGTFTATIATALDFEGSEDTEMRGYRVGVLDGCITEEVAFINGAEPVVYPSTDALIEAASTDTTLHGFLMESLNAQHYSQVLADEGFLLLHLFSHPLIHGILTREQNETTKTCFAEVAHAARVQAMRNAREYQDSTAIKAQLGAKSSSKASALLGLNIIVLLSLAIPLVLLVAAIAILEKIFAKKRVKNISTQEEKGQSKETPQRLNLHGRGFALQSGKKPDG